MSGTQVLDQAHVGEVARRSGSNFYYAFLFLPRRQRQAIHALYAFCREVDDSVDAAPGAAEAALRVAAWRRELDACYAGVPTHPITRSLASHLGAFPIRKADLEEVIEGVSMDISPRSYETFEDLRLYCHRVASAVGLACIEIFGYTDPAARRYAETLGLAFQMTNILRDVRQDAERRRIYLPAADRAACRCPDRDLAAGAPSPAFRALMRMEASRTRALFEEARSTLPRRDRRRLFAAEIMGAIYEAILDEIERRDYDVLRERIALPRLARFGIAARLALLRRVLPFA
ncbi:MAG TPA: presqualene diphosphate synthase HpnD [Candidatus Polarisedimenticolia bacterium]|nr:presqualene diphosphate synthase HpnD [Candidatus Polarisedimenticolia bacterium]